MINARAKKGADQSADLINGRLVLKALAELDHLRAIRFARLTLHSRPFRVQIHHVDGLLGHSLLDLSPMVWCGKLLDCVSPWLVL